MFPKPLDVSLFDLLRNALDDSAPVLNFSKPTLVHLSHMLEDVVLNRRLPAMIFTGFQESSHWRKETRRYLELAHVAKQVTIFAGQPLPADSGANLLQVALADGDLLRQEWFLLILSRSFSVLLCGQDNVQPAETEAEREFATIWTFDPVVIMQALDVLEAVVEKYRPERLDDLIAARTDYPLIEPDQDILQELVSEMMRFEETLSRRLRSANSSTDEALERAHVITETVRDVVLTCDANGAIHYANHIVEATFGYFADELIGVNVQQLLPAFNRGLLTLADATVERASGDSNFNPNMHTIELQARRKDGIFSIVDVSFSLLTHPERANYYTVVIRDITALKQAEQAVRERERLQIEVEKQRELNAMKARFMATVSHEFRTPIALIMSSVEMLERYDDRLNRDQKRERLHTIRTQAQHLRKMMDDIAVVLQAQSGEQNFNFVSFDLQALCRVLVEELTSTSGHDHDLRFVSHGELALVYGDKNLHRSILYHLLTNAIKYSPAQSEIMLELIYTAEQVVLRVIDQGIGIHPEDLPHIYKTFYRGGNANEVTGTGLGLRIVADCVTIYSGDIQVESTVGVGTTFTVILPQDPRHDTIS